MTGDADAPTLRQHLRDELTSRLGPAGWHLIPPVEDRSLTLAAFVHPLGEDFAATVDYHCGLSTPDHPPIAVGLALCGVSFEPLRRLWMLLSDTPLVATLSESVGDMPEWARPCGGVEINTGSEIPAVASQLARVALEHAITFAEQFTSVDALLEARLDGRPAADDMIVPALLAAAGRLSEARNALRDYRADSELPQDAWRTRRYIYQLNRWLASGGDVSLLPSEPPPRRHGAPGSVSLKEGWHEARLHGQAVDGVKTLAGEKDRSSLRSVLESELARRGVRADPLWIEQKLDELGMSRGERAREQGEALRTLGRIGLAAVKAIRAKQLPDFPDTSVPEWLEPPEPAVYAVARNRKSGEQWTAVRLDEGIADWLQGVHAAVPRLVQMVQSATLDAWLDWDKASDDERSIAVHLGNRRVGLLDEDTAVVYSPIIQAAAQRAELPCVEARLTPLSEKRGYLLEVGLPDRTSSVADPERV